MAWVPIPNKPGWEYDNSAVKTALNSTSDTYTDSPGTVTNGIRTYTNESGQVCQTYIKCRQASNPTRILGEVSKTYYDNQR